jgi:hypothetical protein
MDATGKHRSATLVVVSTSDPEPGRKHAQVRTVSVIVSFIYAEAIRACAPAR